ncbi:sigma-70 family RNA polymerase sigma factor [Novosphingobium beihaiensis]|uniref:Sigma-70 family RNA polymerase sigma factor n=1 Tax=Novosphingobium beihaiensis TaxID=2930389 RepID=A0ABT0BPJ4_9SPHN|nr:sigma-70 family RNA polymerase sigma factor [Novosphingobium beihaiensis]MCJ2186980.1 sigma-70 family RNA polymerase sigma factor [Novosphingobium beihaiensis]
MGLLLRKDQYEAALWRKWLQENDFEARARIFAIHQPYARMLARGEVARRAVRPDSGDVEQLAYEGLLQSIDRYDPQGSAGFQQFARMRIIGNIRNGLARDSERNAQYRYRYRAERDRLRSLLPSGKADGDALAALSDLAAGLALGLILDRSEISEDVASVPDEAPNAYESLSWNQLEGDLSAQIETLPAREAFVITQHYLGGVSFTQIAEVLGLSKGRISQLHSAALRRLEMRLSKYR